MSVHRALMGFACAAAFPAALLAQQGNTFSTTSSISPGASIAGWPSRSYCNWHSLQLASTQTWSSAITDSSGAPACTRWPSCTLRRAT